MRSRILVAMSGGVDSSVAAALLHERGHDVFGVTMHLWDASGDAKVGRCCAPEDRDDARRTCDALGVPHYVVDERDAFRANVVAPFVEEYAAGRTPTPCVHCNRTVKLLRLVELADRFGADAIATGHYARIDRDPDGTARLLRGHDRTKDQSYFLFGLPRWVLERLLFPLGDLDKPAVRAEGRRLGVPNAEKPDSQELCFVPDGDIRGFVAAEGAPTDVAEVVDEEGRVLARHEGLAGFTVGQRRGLGVAGGPPRYVLRVLADDRRVVVGPEERLLARGLRATGATWLRDVPEGGFDAEVRIRYRHEAAPARVHRRGAGFEVTFMTPQRAVTPGQAAVVYRGEEVLGGGFIA